MVLALVFQGEQKQSQHIAVEATCSPKYIGSTATLTMVQVEDRNLFFPASETLVLTSDTL